MGGLCRHKWNRNLINQMLGEEASRLIKVAKRSAGEVPEPWIWKPR